MYVVFWADINLELLARLHVITPFHWFLMKKTSEICRDFASVLSFFNLDFLNGPIKPDFQVQWFTSMWTKFTPSEKLLYSVISVFAVGVCGWCCDWPATWTGSHSLRQMSLPPPHGHLATPQPVLVEVWKAVDHDGHGQGDGENSKDGTETPNQLASGR